jgi:glycosyltransferase involved in cell wall biosynthesis
MGYVCAFRGRRDSYQVPVALAEAGKLDRFITDYYCGVPERLLARILPERLAESVLGRFDAGLPSDRVLRLRMTAAAEAAARLSKMSAARVYDIFDPRYGEIAARDARRTKSDLLMYSSYAWEAFNAPYRHTPLKILFQYHPHYALEYAILEADRQASAKLGVDFSGQLEDLVTGDRRLRHRADLTWRMADRVLCASSFTKHSLVEAGADAARISVVPYGVTEPPPLMPNINGQRDSRFHALFVGSGLQRKGLHHLLLAWKRARLPAGARLTVVSRVVEPGFVPLLLETRNVHYLKWVANADLRRLYNSATVFVMPSLVEGFGQVYLEALAQGLPVIGTANTCLPDIGGADDGVFLTSPGEIDELAALLERLSIDLGQKAAIRQSAQACARQFTWDRFRARLREAVP